MNRARTAAPRLAFACAPDELADARYLLTHAQVIRHLPPAYRKATINTAWNILHMNRAAQSKPQPPKPSQTARVLRVPLAVFQAGPSILHRQPRHRITIGPTTTPGDAA